MTNRRPAVLPIAAPPRLGLSVSPPEPIAHVAAEAGLVAAEPAPRRCHVPAGSAARRVTASWETYAAL